MALRRKTFSYLILLCWLCFNFVYIANPEPSSIIIPNEWELINTGWPLEDKRDSSNDKKTQFYYVREKNKYLEWGIKSSFLQKFTDESHIFKLSFKYWSHFEFMRPQSVVVVGKESDDLFARYSPNFDGYWMPCEYFMSYKNLTSFQIKTSTGDGKDIVAFKDFEIEYETQFQQKKSFYETETQFSTELSPQQTNKLSLIEWEEYSPPEITRDSNYFLYFSSNCSNGCTLKSEGINFGVHKTVTEVKLSFEYYMKESSGANIEISNTKLGPITVTFSSTWMPFNVRIKEDKLKDIMINITTLKMKARDNSFVAIKHLKIVVIFTKNDKNKTVDTKDYDCWKNSCEWKPDRNLQWTENFQHLENSSVYYYPKSENNSLELIRRDDLKLTNVCFSIRYWASSEVKINVNFNVINETVKDTILTIRPKVNTFERTHFCLRDLIALSVREYVISFNVKQHKYVDGIKGFAMSIEEPNNTDESWDFNNEFQTFLQPMKLPFNDVNRQISGERSTDWKQLSPDRKGMFEFKEDFIEFTATADSKISASAQLISKWIKYDSNLHSIDPQFSVEVSDPKLFEAFKIRPKVCDWLSHCTDVIMKLENPEKDITRQKLKNFSFKFNPLDHSQYIKLLFYIEYFQPSYFKDNDKELEVKFDLKLTHFGDPCFKSLHCQNKGICVSSFKKDIRNKLLCSCTESWTGELCEKPNYCGSEIYNKKLCHNLECENLDTNYRCLCGADGKDANIIWDNQMKKCVTIKAPETNRDSKWLKTQKGYYPTASYNNLAYKFTNINTDKFDVCFNLYYTSNQTVQLSVNYNHEHNSEKIVNRLFSVSLLEKQSINFCLRDFRYTVNENFELSLQISDVANNYWGENFFTLTRFEPYLKRIANRSVDYINNWDFWERTTASNPSNQYWKSIPNEIFKPVINDKKFSYNAIVNVNSKTPSKVLLVSDWIENNSNFSNSENFAVQYTKSAYNKYFTLKTRAIYQEKEDLKFYYLGVNASRRSVDTYDLIETKISIPNNINSPFKLLFEITYSLPVNEKSATNINITIKSLSIGDPCVKYNSKDHVCKNKDICHGFGPNNYFCECFNQTLCGKNCDVINPCKKENEFKMSNEDFCGYFPSLPNIAGNKCILLTEKSFECRCPEKDYYWNSNFKRCVRNGYTKTVESCEGKKCEILDKIVSDSKWSNKNMPKIDNSILPFYFSSKSDAKLKIQVNNLDNQNDACFQISYEISGGPNLFISYNNLSPINFPLDWYPGGGEEICARSLTKDIDKNFNITIVSKMLTTEDDMIAVRFIQKQDSNVYFKPRELKLLPELPYLTHWSDQDVKDGNYTFGNEWPLALSKFQWSLNSKEYSTITFRAASTVKGRQTSYLMSNWLQKDINGYKLRFNISDTKFENFLIQIIVYDTQMQQKQVSDITIGDKKFNPNARNNINQTYIIAINKMSTSFRVAFKVDYLLKEKPEASFTLKAIDLGDPCVFDNTTDNQCMGRGKCLRNGPVNNYTCVCEDGYTDKNCQTIDYCNFPHEVTEYKKGEEYCQEKAKVKCINGGFGSFSCNCNNDTFWDSTSLECKNYPKCIANDCDFETQDCVEPVDSKAKYTCVCKEKYLNVSTTSSLKCEKFDPCNELHRNRSSKNLSPKPCGKSEAVCKVYDDKDDDYMCVCPKGFQNIGDKESSNCDPLLCTFPSLNTCQQICETDTNSPKKYKCLCKDNYDSNGDNCKLKSGKTCNCKGDAFCFGGPNDCMCKDRYISVTDKNGTNNGCEPIDNYHVSTSICPEGLTNNTHNKLVCECGTAYKLNDKSTCDLKPICGKGGNGRKDCDSRHALCITDENYDVGNYECKCPTGKEFDNPKSMNKTCVDYCAFGKRLENCTKINAECDPTKNSTQSEGDIRNSCFCGIGYVWEQNRCVIGKYTVEFSLTIKNTFFDEKGNKPVIKLAQNQQMFTRSKRSFDSNKFSADLFGFFVELKSMKEENNKLRNKMRLELEPIRFSKQLITTLKPIIEMTTFSEVKERLAVKKCEINSNYYNCVFTMSLKNPIESYGNQSFNEQLAKLCISYPGESKNCFFPKTGKVNSNGSPDSSQSKLYSLVINKEILAKSSVTKYKPCEESQNQNNCPQYSNCVDDKDPDLSLFSCVCNDKYFTSTNPLPLPIEGDNHDVKAFKFQCKVKDELCKYNCVSKEKHGTCLQSSPKKDKNNDWIVPYYCGCDDKFKLSNDSKSCVGVCDGIKCNHGNCTEIGSTGYTCECNEGWNGKNCDSQYKAGVTVWVIVIVVLGVLIVITAILAIVFVMKAKNADKEISDRPHPMTEYPGTSYKVERSRGAVPRQQSTNRGEENPTFHRD